MASAKDPPSGIGPVQYFESRVPERGGPAVPAEQRWLLNMFQTMFPLNGALLQGPKEPGHCGVDLQGEKSRTVTVVHTL